MITQIRQQLAQFRSPKALFYATILLLLLLIPRLALANEVDEAIQRLFSLLNIILLFLQAFLWPILVLIGGLLSNDLLFSGGMNETITRVWVAVRDFVNIFFVFVLLGVAIANVLGMSGETYQPAKFLPKFAIALIFVNFSLFGARFILDIVNISTAAVFSIPVNSGLLTEYNYAQDDSKLANKLCPALDRLEKQRGRGSEDTGITGTEAGTFIVESENDAKSPTAWCMPAGQSAPQSGQASPPASQTPTPAPQGGSGSGQPASAATEQTPLKFQLTSKGKELFARLNQNNIALVLAIEMMEIVSIDTVNAEEVTGLKNLTINTLFSIVFFVIYASAFVALFITLLVRLAVLWVTIVLSPLIALGLTGLKTFEDRFSSTEGDTILGNFIKHAIIPLKASFVLVLGTIMVTQIKKVATGETLGAENASFGAITSTMSIVQDMLVGVATAAFIWLAVFEALKDTKAEGFVNTIKSSVEEAGKYVAKTPLYFPIIPVKGGKKVGLAAIPMLARRLPQSLGMERERELAEKLGLNNSPSDTINKDVTDVLSKRGSAQKQGVQDILNKVGSSGNTQKIDSASRKELIRLLKDSGVRSQVGAQWADQLSAQLEKNDSFSYQNLRQMIDKNPTLKREHKRSSQEESALRTAKDIVKLNISKEAKSKSQAFAEQAEKADYKMAGAKISPYNNLRGQAQTLGIEVSKQQAGQPPSTELIRVTKEFQKAMQDIGITKLDDQAKVMASFVPNKDQAAMKQLLQQAGNNSSPVPQQSPAGQPQPARRTPPQQPPAQPQPTPPDDDDS